MSHLHADACVIGAGPAGLAAGKALADRRIEFDWYEKGSMVGGLWRIDNDNGQAVAYQTLHLNSSRQRTQFPSYPMPRDWPDYPSHRLVAQYFQGFAEDNGLLDRIAFNSEVTRVEPLPGMGRPGDGRWAVTCNGERRTYRSVLVANGHHSVASVPQFPGEFTGECFHASAYRDPTVFVGKDVLVVGVGNSGMDISCDAAAVARTVYLATRHGVHVLPKYVLGRPIDHFAGRANGYIPFALERFGYEALLRLTVGRPQDRGLPQPDHRLLEAHPTASAQLYDRVGHGDIVMKPSIEELDGDKVRFVDGSVEHVDTLVLATGYRVAFPFLAPEVVDPAGNRMPLYQRIVSPDRPGLYFIGFIQTVGANIALMEYQSEWVGDLILGRAALPSREEMRRWIEHDQAAMARRYVRSERHTMQVDYWRYVRAMKQERARRTDPSSLDGLRRLLAGLRA